jgi:drug/metabolite transporter (DMT)-like permease
MTGELSALGLALLWGLSGLLLKGLSARFGSMFLNSLRCIGGTIAILPLVILTGAFSPPGGITAGPVLGIIGGTIITIGVGDTLFVMALKRLDYSRAYPIYICGFPLLTVVIAWIVLGESLTPVSTAGVILILSGLLFIAFPSGPIFSKINLGTPRERSGLLFVTLSLIAAAGGTVLLTSFVAKIDFSLANFIRYGAVGIILVLLSAREWAGLLRGTVSLKHFSIGLLNGALSMGAGGWWFLYSLDTIGAAMTSVLTSTSPLFVLPLSVKFLKEKITRKLVLGVALSVGGVALVFLPQIFQGLA